jgi:drug/metabolite transporter (DMT)-like permease
LSLPVTVVLPETVLAEVSAGLVVGLGGVALVVGLQALNSVGWFLSALAVLGAAASGAISSFVVKLQYREERAAEHDDPLLAKRRSRVIAAPFAAIFASGHAPGVRAILVVSVLGLFCTALTFMLYYDLIAEVGEERVALGNYITPSSRSSTACSSSARRSPSHPSPGSH